MIEHQRFRRVHGIDMENVKEIMWDMRTGEVMVTDARGNSYVIHGIDTVFIDPIGRPSSIVTAPPRYRVSTSSRESYMEVTATSSDTVFTVFFSVPVLTASPRTVRPRR